MAHNRTPAQIEQDLVAARERLAENLAALVSEVHPRVVARRTVSGLKEEACLLVEEGKQQALEALVRLKGCYQGAEGPVKQALTIASTVAVLALIVVAVKKK